MMSSEAETSPSEQASSEKLQAEAGDRVDQERDQPPSVSLNSLAADATLLKRVIDGVREVYDPEIPLNIYDLGLIYRINIDERSHVEIDMTLTSPMCPVAGSLPGEVEMAARGVDGVSDVVVELVWEPTWGPEVMSEAARLELGIF